MNLPARLVRAGVELGQRVAQDIHTATAPLSLHDGRARSDPPPDLSRLNTILEQVGRSLRENILRFWVSYAPDLEYGGFITHLDRDGRRSGPTDKYLVMQARVIWTLAAAHRHGLTEARYLEIAARGIEFLIDRMWDREHGGFVWVVGRGGDPVDSRKILYGQAFAIYALAEFSIAAQDRSALAWAEQTLEVVQHHASDGDLGFRERFARDWATADSTSQMQKTVNAHLHLMEALTTLVEASRDESHAALLRQVVEILLYKAIDQRHHFIGEQFDHVWRDETLWRRPTNVSYGHGVEAAWLLRRALDALGDDREERRNVSLQLIDHALAYGFDHERGGLAQYGPPVGDARHAVYFNRRRLTKRWWEQAEMLVATLEAYRWTRDRHYLQAFVKQFDWIWRYQIDHEYGEWFESTTWRDGRPLGLHKGDDWKCPYHTARALMEVSRGLRAILTEP